MPLAGAGGHPLSLVATCASGLEELLAGELAALGYDRREAPLVRDDGAVRFAGDWRDVWRANLWLRTANRVLVGLGRWQAEDDLALAGGAERLVAGDGGWGGVDVAAMFDPERSLAVHATTTASRLTDTRWVAMRTKDGIVDGQRGRFGRRSFVDREDPTVPLRLRLHRDEATLLLDTSGLSLDHRGYRSEAIRAPVRESLAAACALAALAGWERPDKPLVVDPMCGSGTLLVETAWALLGWAPGRLRERWGYERLAGYLPAVAAQLRSEARLAEPRPAKLGLRLLGRDLDPTATQAARVVLIDADLAGQATITTGDAFALERPRGVERGLVVVNPPWGERLAGGEALWSRLGRLLRERFAGFRAVVLAGDPARAALGLEPIRRLPVRAGALEVAISVYDLE